MNELFEVIASDLGISRCKNETEDNYINRICYSSIGVWCLSLSFSKINEINGISKNTHTTMLNNIIGEYCIIQEPFSEYILDNKRGHKLSSRIRDLYENVGYLVTNQNNKNTISPYGLRVNTKEYKDLYLGLSKFGLFEMNGLGVFTDSLRYSMSVNEFLVRDKLTAEELVTFNYDICDFEDRDFDINEFMFFNPLLKKAPSQSWQSNMETDYSIARKNVTGPYFRVIKKLNGKLVFSEEFSQPNMNQFYKDDFRRLYFALKAYYGNNQPIWISKMDDNYISIRLSAKLPFREYYLLLLTSWPIGNVFNTRKYILRKELLPFIKEAFKNIYISVEES